MSTELENFHMRNFDGAFTATLMSSDGNQVSQVRS